ncbi:MAG: adenylate/guanylate cyclase domain-containing protein [Prosthecobacter sp.]|uniref:adenylate/guanylate cyclase domain-containing protein n=1 Tax=Prosthecobacter sp. TaxID=1965333 RepID=UPI003902F1A1
MKWFSSFRARLILTVFPVVAGITIATLVLAEWKFMAAYRRLFEEQFESQINTFTAAKKKRSEALSTVLGKIAKEPEVLEAIAKKDYGAAAQIMRPQLEALAVERLQSELPSSGGPIRLNVGGTQRPPQPFGQRGNGDDKDRSNAAKFVPRLSPGQLPFIGLIDIDGNFLTAAKKNGPGDKASGGFKVMAPELMEAGDSGEMRRRGGRMQWLSGRKLEDILKEQEVGYLRVEYGENNRSEQVREVFITPLRDEKNGKFLGAFLFGLPLPVLAERLLYEQSKKSDLGEIMSGVWVEDALVSTTIPKDIAAIIEKDIAASIQHSGKSQREITVPINGVRHQIFYRVLNPGSPFPLAAQVNLYPLNALDHELNELRRDVGGLGFVALLIALLVVLYISRGLSGPISDIVSGTHQIEQGNFDVRVRVRRQDELGKLAASFNEMAAGLALQEKYRSVLNAVADRTVAQQLIEQSSGLGGELRHVTMLFCDIRGFTAITENMPPAEVIELLNEHMTALTEVAYEHGGIVDKFVGDLIMVLFGAPVSTGADAAHAVQCALRMLQVRRHLNQTSKHSLEVGIGLATGSVVAGCMGSDQRLSYTVLGHRVNLASRLCSIAQAGEIVMDAETYAEAQELIQAEPMPPMQLKGISEPVHPWRVVAA